jgi:hypothetical protein
MGDIVTGAIAVMGFWVPCLLLMAFIWRFGTPRAGWPGSRLRWAVVTVIPVPAFLTFLGGANLWLGGGGPAALALALSGLAILVAGLAWGIVPRGA